METPVILSAVRTPIGKFQGGLAGFSAPELGGKIVAEAIRRAGIESKQVDEAILGNVVQAGLGQNPARQAALKGGCDPRVAAMTINKVCGSGLKRWRWPHRRCSSAKVKSSWPAGWNPCPIVRIFSRRREPGIGSVMESWSIR